MYGREKGAQSQNTLCNGRCEVGGALDKTWEPDIQAEGISSAKTLRSERVICFRNGKESLWLGYAEWERERKIKHMREKSEKESKREITGNGKGERRHFPTFPGEDYKDEQSREEKKWGVHTDYFMEIGREFVILEGN